MKFDVKSLKNVDKAKLKAFFLAHGEKVGFGFFMLCFLLLLKSAISVPRYDKSPEDLQGLADQKQSQIASATFNADSLGIVVPDFVSELPVLTATRRAKPMRITTNFSTPMLEMRGRRGNPPRVAMPRPKATYNWGVIALQPLPVPETFVAEDPLADPLADSGKSTEKTMRVSDVDREGIQALVDQPADLKPPAGVRFEAREWVVITGKIPVAEQIAKFREAYKNTHTVSTDNEVTYLGYEIQRAEVGSPNAKVSKEDWKPLNLKALGAEVAEWANAPYPPLVDTTYVHPNMTMSLPPMVGRNHGEEVAYPPEIPLKSKVDPALGRAPQAGAVGQPRPGGFVFPGGKPAAAQPAPAVAPEAEPEGPPPLLFRLFDFTAKEGRYYRYRVRLALKNPNFGIPRQYLKPPKEGEQPLNEVPTLNSPWSKPSTAVMVRRNDDILAGEVSPGRSALDDRLKLMVNVVDPDKGFYVVNEFECTRGQLVNFHDEQVVVQPLENAQGAPVEEPVSVRTKLTLVDMLGGEGRRLEVQTTRNGRPLPVAVVGKAPADVLVVAPDGQVIVRSELEDFHDYRELRLRHLKLEMKYNGEPIEKTDQKSDSSPFGSGSPFK